MSTLFGCVCLNSSIHKSNTLTKICDFSGFCKKSTHTEISVVVQSLSPVWLFAIPWTAALQASLSFTISLSLIKLMSIELVMPSNHLIHCCPLLFLPSIFPSIIIGLFQWVGCLHQWHLISILCGFWEDSHLLELCPPTVSPSLFSFLRLCS